MARSVANMNPHLSAYYAVDTVTCKDCDDNYLNYGGVISSPLEYPDAVITYNKGIAVKAPEWVNDPTRRASCTEAKCSAGSFRSLVTKNVGSCTICG